MNDVNACLFTGRVSMDPKLSYGQGGGARLFFTIACNQTVNEEQVADFIPVVMFGKFAEAVAKTLEKGNPVTVCGKLSVRSVPNDGGGYTTYTNIKCDNFINHGRSGNGNGNGKEKSAPPKVLDNPEDLDSLFTAGKEAMSDELEDTFNKYFE